MRPPPYSDCKYMSNMVGQFVCLACMEGFAKVRDQIGVFLILGLPLSGSEVGEGSRGGFNFHFRTVIAV